jgi:cell wall-associated NlpC family hydrolase
MPRKLYATLALAGTASAVAASTVAAAPPALRAKRAQAQVVLAQVNALDLRFGHVVDAWDGARIQLAASTRRLAANRRALQRARRQSRIADQRLAQRLVAIYEGGEPTLTQVLVGASSVSDLIDRLEAAKEIAAYDRRVADQARRSRDRLAEARLRLQAAQRTQRATLAALGAERRQIGAMLAHRRRLLASIQSEIAAIKAREAAEQAALAAAARARLAREQALLARAAAERAAAERAAAERAQAQPAAAAPSPADPATTPAQTTAAATDAATTATATTTTVPAATTGTPPPPAPAPALGAGHPEAAVIALRYLGVPYQWGGASPATGFDCSGLVMYVYAQLGIELPHQAAAQYGYGVAVPRDQLQPGDLVFYDGLSHVGIYIGNGDIVHAPHTGDVVKISPLSQGGASYVGARRL